MFVNDGDLEKEVSHLEILRTSPELLEAQRQREHTIETSVRLLENVVEVVLNDQKAA